MNEQKLYSKVMDLIERANQGIAELDDSARIELIVLQNFKPTLYSLLESNKEDEFLLRLEDFTTEECNIDLRTLIDAEVRRELYRKGYDYIENQSDYNKLLFRKDND